jgi:hypothetical protein
MAFDQTETQIIKRGQELGKSRQDVEKAILNYRSSAKTSAPVEKPGYLERVGSELKGAAQGLQKTTTRGAELMNEGKGVEGAFMSGLGAAGSAVRAAFSPITAALTPAITKGLEASGVLENEKVQEKLATFDTWAKQNPDAAENLKNIFEVGTAIGGGRAVSAVAPTVSRVAKATTEAAGGAVRTGMEAVAPVASGAVELASRAGQKISNLPSNVKTNVGGMQAETALIKSLPSKTAQNAARSGVDPVDLRNISNITPLAKSDVKLLTDNIVKFAKGESDIDPIEFVGKPIVARVKQLENTRKSVGAKLSEVSKKLGTVTNKEVFTPVLTKLQQTQGLEGLKVGKNGNLDFTDTTLTTAETASDRKAIQDAFLNAVKDGTGEQKHLLRQELFEVLGGKKSSQTPITGTQERAYEAIRSGLSDVLDTKNKDYKKLNNQYRQIVQPLVAIRKKLKATDPNLTEDILDMNAGMLARRITSTSMSRGEVQNLIQALDRIGKAKSSVWERTKALQDTYSILNKYYDIAPKTGFQGVTEAAIGGATGVLDVALGGVKKVAGQTPAVRQQALEEFLSEFLR